MQFSLFDEPERKTIKIKVKREVYKRAKGRCENPRCRIKLAFGEGDFHHTRSPSISPTAKTVQFLCPTCHRKYGHKRKTVKHIGLFDDEKEAIIKRRRVGHKKTLKKKKRVPAEYDFFGDVIRWKYVTVKPKKKSKTSKKKQVKRKTSTKKKTTTRKKRKTKKKPTPHKKKTTKKKTKRRKR